MNIDKEAIRFAIAKHLGIQPQRRWRVFYDKDRQAGSWNLISREDALHNVALTRAGDIRCGYIHDDYSAPEEYEEWIDVAPRFDSDLNAAWQLVEWMRKEGAEPAMIPLSPDAAPLSWGFSFKAKHGWVFAYAETFSTAICFAFAKANSIPIPQLTT